MNPTSSGTTQWVAGCRFAADSAARSAVLNRRLSFTREGIMTLQVRRVVTGHDKDGRAIVQIDEVSRNLRSARPGATACVIWTSEGFPIDNTGTEDEGLR